MSSKLTMAVAMLAILPATCSANGVQANAQGNPPQSLRSVVTSGPVTLTVTVSKPLAHVAEPLELMIQVEAPQGTRVKMPAIDDSLGEFTVLDRTDVGEIPVGDQLDARRWQQQITLETITTGELPVPPLEVLYALGPSQAGDSLKFQAIHSEPLVVRIASVLEDRADPRVFRDIKDVVDVEVPPQASRAWIGWTVVTICSFAAIASLIALAMRRRPISPAEWALREISRLEKSDLQSTAQTDATYGELADITREFIGLQLGIATQAQTTQEFLTAFLTGNSQETVLHDAAQEHLKAFLSSADEVKFARLQPNPDHLCDAVRQVRLFIATCQAAGHAIGQEGA